MEGKIKIFQADRAKLQAINKSCQKKLTILEDNLEATRTVCANLNDFCTRAEGKLKEFQARRTDLEATHNSLHEQCTQLTSQVADLLSKLSVSETAAKEQVSALTDKEHKIKELQQHNVILNETISSLKTQIGLLLLNDHLSSSPLPS